VKIHRICALLLSLLVVPTAQPAEGDLKRAADRYLRGDFRAAAELLEGIARAEPGNAEVHLQLGKSYLRLRRYNDAVRELERAVALDPGSSRYHLWLGRAYGEKAAHASKRSAFGIARKVSQEFETAVRLDPDNMDARSDSLDFYLEAPGLVGGGRDKAEAEAREIAARNAARGHAARARIYCKDKKWDLALAEYERAIASAPQASEPYLVLAEYLLERGDFPRAERVAGQALGLNPASLEAKLLLAAARVSQGKDLDAAAHALSEMAAGPLGDADPSFAEVYYWLGRAYAARGETAAAREALKTALQFDPDYAKPKEALSRLEGASLR